MRQEDERKWDICWKWWGRESDGTQFLRISILNALSPNTNHLIWRKRRGRVDGWHMDEIAGGVDIEMGWLSMEKYTHCRLRRRQDFVDGTRTKYARKAEKKKWKWIKHLYKMIWEHSRMCIWECFLSPHLFQIYIFLSHWKNIYFLSDKWNAVKNWKLSLTHNFTAPLWRSLDSRHR